MLRDCFHRFKIDNCCGEPRLTPDFCFLFYDLTKEPVKVKNSVFSSCICRNKYIL